MGQRWGTPFLSAKGVKVSVSLSSFLSFFLPADSSRELEYLQYSLCLTLILHFCSVSFSLNFEIKLNIFRNVSVPISSEVFTFSCYLAQGRREKSHVLYFPFNVNYYGCLFPIRSK